MGEVSVDMRKALTPALSRSTGRGSKSGSPLVVVLGLIRDNNASNPPYEINGSD